MDARLPRPLPDPRCAARNGARVSLVIGGLALAGCPGAPPSPTASAIVADLMDLARDIGAWQTCRVPPLGFAREQLRDLPIVPMAEVQTPWYLRMEVEDKPGVLSAVASIFSEQGISIEALIQKAPAEGQSRVQLIVLTNKAAQGMVDLAVASIEALDTISGKVTRIRVEGLDG